MFGMGTSVSPPPSSPDEVCLKRDIAHGCVYICVANRTLASLTDDPLQDFYITTSTLSNQQVDIGENALSKLSSERVLASRYGLLTVATEHPEGRSEVSIERR